MFRMLLVIAALYCAQAHCAVTSQHPRLLQALGDATKALQAAQQSLEEALRQPPSPALTSVSVVQDWSLVCKELCGAGLGVAPCAEYCAKSGKVETTTVLSKDFDLAKCEQLPGSSTDSECNTVESVQSFGTRLCKSYCHQRRRTLNGCSPCQLLDVLDEVSTEQSVTTHGSGEGKARLTEVPAMVKIEASSADDGTPDWDEMCKTLCKTGDGGSLCNCDLSPFFT
ncbi:uncharacterized protein LOC135433519 [Drosophila montana]|uniref:uncharacterized protein LOC135433519 n=1 Tax=Drosophila montana TaxID=40370 RepID=UPI00313A8365